ncbi:MAG: flavin reductase family protein [Gemmatimonadota bacterium]|nr:MAG: flavin reductase family protein [Gemmatimonadota bacterium]
MVVLGHPGLTEMKRLEEDLSAGIWTLPSFPVVLVTAGENVMTAGAFHFYSFDPPSLMVGIMPDKYTHDLITEHGDFGINIPTVDQIQAVRICGAVSGRDVPDKFARAGLSPFDGLSIKSYLIKECPLNIECKVVHRLAYKGSHQWFVGEIKAVHRDDSYEPDQALMFWGRAYRKVGELLEGV